MTKVKGIAGYLIVLMIGSTLLGIGSLQSGFSQPPPGAQPPTAESLNYIVQLFVKETVAKFDAVLFQGKLMTGKLTNTELAFRLDTGELRSLKRDEIAALLFETGKAQIVLQSGERLYGQLLTDMEIVPVGSENQRATFTHDSLHIGLGMIVLSGQLQHLTNAEFQELLTRFLSMIMHHDIVVFRNDSMVAGTVTNQVFQIDEFYFIKQDIAEIIFGSPCQLRAWSGQVVSGTVRTPTVTVEFSPTSFTFSTQSLARILFTDRTISFRFEEPKGLGRLEVKP